MQVTIENLNACLDGSKQYETPLFQRPFAWKEKHWQRLWEDLLSYYDDANDYVKAKHFMGRSSFNGERGAARSRITGRSTGNNGLQRFRFCFARCAI